MSKYYYSSDGPSQLIIKKDEIYYAILYSENTLCLIDQNYSFFPLTLNILLKRNNWYTNAKPFYISHLKLALENLANE